MAEVTIDMIKELRGRTGAGMMDVKKALLENDGDMDKATDWLREKGIAKQAKRAGKIASEGLIDSYIHGAGRVGVLIEVNCETDYAAASEDFKNFVHDLTLQIAAMNPQWVSKEDVDPEALEHERSIVRAEALNEGKPEKIVDKIVDGRMNKFFSQHCLLEQEFVKDDSKKIQDLLNEVAVKIGEKLSIRRFVRYELGEGMEKKEEDFAAEVMDQLK